MARAINLNRGTLHARARALSGAAGGRTGKRERHEKYNNHHAPNAPPLHPPPPARPATQSSIRCAAFATHARTPLARPPLAPPPRDRLIFRACSSSARRSVGGELSRGAAMTTPPPSGGFGERDWLNKHGRKEGSRPTLSEAQRPAAATVFGLALHACHETGARRARVGGACVCAHSSLPPADGRQPAAVPPPQPPASMRRGRQRSPPAAAAAAVSPRPLFPPR